MTDLTMEDCLEGLQRLHTAALEQSTSVRKTRAVSKMVRNLQAGDVIEWPFGLGIAPITGWHNLSGSVTLSGPENRLVAIPEKERVRVIREVNA